MIVLLELNKKWDMFRHLQVDGHTSRIKNPFQRTHVNNKKDMVVVELK